MSNQLLGDVGATPSGDRMTFCAELDFLQWGPQLRLKPIPFCRWVGASASGSRGPAFLFSEVIGEPITGPSSPQRCTRELRAALSKYQLWK